jgi:hypothetical protein
MFVSGCGMLGRGVSDLRKLREGALLGRINKRGTAYVVESIGDKG